LRLNLVIWIIKNTNLTEVEVFVLIRPENLPWLKPEKRSSTIGIGFHFLCCFGRWLNIIEKGGEK
jgi:hypothetical protein